jgi:hypothetical protein
VPLLDISGILNSICTPFWLEEKRWFVAYEDGSSFSIHYFAQNDIDISQSLHIASTAPNNTFLCNHLNKITIKRTTPIRYNDYFIDI